MLADIAKKDSYSDVRKAAIANLTDIKLLKKVAGKYFSDINTVDHRKCEDDTWQKAEDLVNIAKRFPEILKENWGQIDPMIKRLSKNVHYNYNDINDDCGYTHTDYYCEKTAASLGLIFPPYPFND